MPALAALPPVVVARGKASFPGPERDTMTMRRVISLLPLMLSLSLAGTGQEKQEPVKRLRTTVELVLVPVTVKDSAGNAVLDLRQEDFRIFDDGVEQKISVFSAEPFPLSVVLLVDDDLPPRTADFVDKSLGAVSGGLGPRDEAAVILFEQFPRTVVEFIADNDKFHDALKRVELVKHTASQESPALNGPPRLNTAPIETGVPSASRVANKGSKNLDDAILAAGQMLRERGRDRRKIILIVSDGKNSRNNTASREDVMRVLLSSDISVYAVGVSEAVLNRGTSALAKYAVTTGGDVFYAPGRGGLENNYSRVLDEARNQYTLAYTPQGNDRAKEYHALEVRARRASLTVLTRDGYFLAVTP
jgi:Ca-activated chloride channel family protein